MVQPYAGPAAVAAGRQNAAFFARDSPCPSHRVRRSGGDGRSVILHLNGRRIGIAWLGEGGLRQARETIAGRGNRPDIAAARRMSPGARAALSAEGIGWVDETGAAEIALGSLIVSRTGRSPAAPVRPLRWTPSVLAVAEALLCGGRATVDTMRSMTGLSAGSATNALRTLTDLGLTSAEARRGRNSARRIPDENLLLDAYAAAAVSIMPEPLMHIAPVARFGHHIWSLRLG